MQAFEEVPKKVTIFNGRTVTEELNKIRETFRFMIRMAKPSAMADLPTPGSPINTGLFFTQ